VDAGLVYFTDAYAPQAAGLLAELQQRWPGVAWAGCVGVGVAASGVEYFDEPALVLMLCDLPPQQFEVFSGARPLSRIAPTPRWCMPTRPRPTSPS
jgi:small ligand-binding sensory domain FIST